MSDACGVLHGIANDLARLRFPFDTAQVPSNGIYLLFEQGEKGHGGDRIVRVGTHRGQGNLPTRLNGHFLRENKDRSIFRKNIGRALLSQAGDPFIDQWQLDLTTAAARKKLAPSIDWVRKAQSERQVTERIQGTFSFVVLRVTDRAQRRLLESKMIATVASCDHCGPSAAWLGRFSPDRRIAASGLWLVQHLRGAPLSVKEAEGIRKLAMSE